MLSMREKSMENPWLDYWLDVCNSDQMILKYRISAKHFNTNRTETELQVAPQHTIDAIAYYFSGTPILLFNHTTILWYSSSSSSSSSSCGSTCGHKTK